MVGEGIVRLQCASLFAFLVALAPRIGASASEPLAQLDALYPSLDALYQDLPPPGESSFLQLPNNERKEGLR